MRRLTMARFEEPDAVEIPVGSCVGCLEDIFAGEDIWDIDGDLLHDEYDCMKGYVDRVSIKRLA